MEELPDGSSHSAAKLKALFATEQQKLQVGNPTFQYHPPKLPHLSSSSSSSTHHSLLLSRQVLHSTEILESVSTLPSGRQESYGSGSIVILEHGPHQSQPARIVVCNASKVSVLDLPVSEHIALQPDTDCWITIETKEHALKVKFYSAAAWVEFAKAYIHAHYHAAVMTGFQPSTILQDITMLTDNVRRIEDGDMVQLLYKMLVAKPATRQALFEEASEMTIKLEIGSRVATELEESVKGMQKGGRRLVIFEDPQAALHLYDLNVLRVRKRKPPIRSGDEVPIKEVTEVISDSGTENSLDASKQTSDTGRKTESITDRLARMARAGAAIDLHLFGVPTHKLDNPGELENEPTHRLEDSREIEPELTDSLDSLALKTEPTDRMHHTSELKTEPIEKTAQLEAGKTVGEEGNHNDNAARKGVMDPYIDLLQDIKRSQTCISNALQGLSSRVELFTNPQARSTEELNSQNLEYLDTGSNSDEDNLVNSVARIMAENRELKRRLEETRTQNAAFTNPKRNETQERSTEWKEARNGVEHIMQRVYEAMETELNRHLDPTVSSTLLDALQQQLKNAATSISTIMNDELPDPAAAEHNIPEVMAEEP